jgi:hypothetical protein
MNRTQRLISDISGYCGLGEAGARNDAYYDLDNMVDKVTFLLEYCHHVEGYENINAMEIAVAHEFLEYDFGSSGERYEAFDLLGGDDE